MGRLKQHLVEREEQQRIFLTLDRRRIAWIVAYMEALSERRRVSILWDELWERRIDNEFA